MEKWQKDYVEISTGIQCALFLLLYSNGQPLDVLEVWTVRLALATLVFIAVRCVEEMLGSVRT